MLTYCNLGQCDPRRASLLCDKNEHRSNGSGNCSHHTQVSAEGRLDFLGLTAHLEKDWILALREPTLIWVWDSIRRNSKALLCQVRILKCYE